MLPLGPEALVPCPELILQPPVLGIRSLFMNCGCAKGFLPSDKEIERLRESGTESSGENTSGYAPEGDAASNDERKPVGPVGPDMAIWDSTCCTLSDSS